MHHGEPRSISALMSLLAEEDRLVCRPIIDHLLALGYVPVKQKVRRYVLSFRHQQTNKVIAKIGVRGDGAKAVISLKFFACSSAPDKFGQALRREVESHDGQYCVPVRSATEKNRCGRCDSCTGGGLGYYHLFPDGREVVRCGAYPIAVPDLAPGDVEEVKRLIDEQHHYLQSLCPGQRDSVLRP